MAAFVLFGFTAQLMLLAFFSAYRWRPAYIGRFGRLVYGMGLVAAALAAAFIVMGQPWYLALALMLYAIWAVFGWVVDIARPVPWRRPPRWSILVPYAGLHIASLLALWVPLWYVDRGLWIAFGLLYAAYTILNITSHFADGGGQHEPA